MYLNIRTDIMSRLGSLTLSEYSNSKIKDLCLKYSVSPVTLQNYAVATFGLERKPTPSKLQEKYKNVDWSLTDTQIARVFASQRKVSEDKKKKLIRSIAERVRQVRNIMNKPKSPSHKTKRLSGLTEI